MADQGRLSEALLGLRELCLLRTEDANAARAYVQLLLDERMYKEILSDSSDLAAKFGAESWLHEAIGRASVKTGDFQGAEEAYRRGIALDPNNSELVSKLAGVVWKLRGSEDAVSLLTEHLEQNRAKGPILAKMGRIAFWDGRLAEAERAYLRALEEDGKNEEALLGLAYLHLDRNDPLKAMEFAKRNTGDTYEASVATGLALQKLSGFGDAVSVFEHAFSLNPVSRWLAKKLAYGYLLQLKPFKAWSVVKRHFGAGLRQARAYADIQMSKTQSAKNR